MKYVLHLQETEVKSTYSANKKAINSNLLKNKWVLIEVPLFIFGTLRHIASSFVEKYARDDFD